VIPKGEKLWYTNNISLFLCHPGDIAAFATNFFIADPIFQSTSETRGGIMSREKPMPQDYLRLCLERRVKVQVLGEREIGGLLHAFDEHSSLIIGDASETFQILTPDNQIGRQTRLLDLVFVRGEQIITIAALD
jgi:U6 snRNA-associated Sm-like protein LSm3